MFSTENPPDPPCSCKISGLRVVDDDDDRPSSSSSDKLTLLKSTTTTGRRLVVDDDHKQVPTFSIRDHVFTARQKNIGTNWPFPQQYLQLCLRHGIKELLPPFEPPDLVRIRFCGSDRPVLLAQTRTNTGVVDVGLHDEVDKHVLRDRTDRESCEKTDCPVVRSSDRAPSLPSPEPEKLTFTDHVREEVPSTVITHEEYDEQELASTNITSYPGQEALKLPPAPQKNENAVETSGKKFRLVVKLGSLSDPSRAEHITPNTTTISDPMASKVCPVCKTFSSTSNTTLNAHIDQCLSVESTSKWAIDAAKLTKHRIKPRKMRSMTDIYLTAPRCTLEDLDRRNGSNWATDLSLLNAEAKIAAEGKRKRSSRTGLQDVEDVGAVYFDSNGTKVRILSKFCNPSVSAIGEDSRPRKHAKDGIQSKTISIDKKIHLGPKHPSNLKPKIQKKKSCRPLHDGALIPGAPEAKHGMDKKQEKEESLSQLLKTRGQTTHIESGTLRQWVCSKRTGLLKKLNGKYNPRGLGYPLPMTRVPSVKNNQLDLGNSLVEGSHLLKIQNPPENAISSPHGKFVESVSYERRISGSREQSSKPSANHLNQLINGGTLSSDGGCALELSRSSGKFSLYPRSKRIEVHADQIKRSNSLPRMTLKPSQDCQLFSIRGKKSSTLTNGLSAQQPFPSSKSNKSRKRSTLKKSRMHRSIAEMTELVQAPPFELDGQCDQMHDSSGNLSGCSNQMQRTDKFDSSSEAGTLCTEVVMDKFLVGGRGLRKSREEGEDSSISGMEEPMTLNSSYSGSEICGLDLASTDDSRVRVSSLQFQCSDTVMCKSGGLETDAVLLQKDSVNKTFSKEAVRGTVNRCSKSLDLELKKPLIPSGALSNSLRSTGEHERLVLGNEPPMRLIECPSGNQVTCATDVGSKIFCNSSVELKTNYRVGERNGCGTGHALVPVLSGSFPVGSVNLGSPEDHQDRLSLASSKIVPSHGHRDTSGSPVSASSTISHPLIARTDSNYSVPESSGKPPESQDQFVSGFSTGGSEPVAGKASPFSSVDAVERMNFDIELHRGTGLSTREGTVKLTHDQFCCAQKDGISWDAASAYQDSQVPGQCTTTMMMQPAKEVTFTPSNRLERDDKMVAPIIETSDGPITVKGPSGPIQKPPIHGGLGSAGPSSQVHNVQSTSNPILRLMGKNLMVVNKDENASVQITQPPPGGLSDYTDIRYSHLLGFSNSSTRSQDQSSFCHTVPEGFAFYRQESCDPPSQCFAVNIPKGYGSQSNSEISERSPQPLAGDYNNLDMGGFSRSSLMRHGFSGAFNFQAQERMAVSRPVSSFSYDAERVASAPCLQNMNSVSATQASGGLMREVIVIDDFPDNEAESRMIYAERSHRLRERQPSLMGNLPSAASYSNLRHVSAFPCHMASHSFSPRELPGGSRSDFSIPCPGKGNANPLEWGDNSELSAVKLRSPFMAQTPFTSHLCPTMYYSPSMS